MDRKIIGVCSGVRAFSKFWNKSDFTVVTAIFKFLLRGSSRSPVLLLANLVWDCSPHYLNANALLLLPSRSPIYALTNWQGFSFPGEQSLRGSAGCSPAKPTAECGSSGDTVLCAGVTCPFEASPRRNGGEVAKRMAEGENVCVGTDDCSCSVPRRLE